MRPLPRWLHPARVSGWAAVGFVALFVLAPLAFMLRDTVWWDGRFTLAPWKELLQDPVDRRQMLHSLQLGLVGTTLSVVLGLGHAWFTVRTDLPGAGWLGPLGVAPLVMPPILVAMAFSDFADTRGFLACAALLGLAHAPFVAVLAARGLRSVDGRAYEAALLARGPRRARRWLLGSIAPEVAAGALLAFVFIVSDHGVPEFLTVKGKTWHTYAEGIFARWTRRATGVDAMALASPVVAAVPLVLVIATTLAIALRLRARPSVPGDFRPLPIRRLGRARGWALLVPLAYLGAGVVLPVVVMALWGAGSTQVNEPISAARLLASLRMAVREAGPDLAYTLQVGGWTTLLVVAVSLPLCWWSARRHRWLDGLSAIPVAVPAILLGIGAVKVFNRDLFGGFYDGQGVVAATYAARFLPFGVLTLSAAVRRIPEEQEEVARLTGRGPLVRGARILGPLMLPAAWSSACLAFLLALRELDLAVVLPAGNGTVVRRLSNIVHFGGEDMGGALALLLLLAAVLVPLLTVIATGRRMDPLS